MSNLCDMKQDLCISDTFQRVSASSKHTVCVPFRKKHLCVQLPFRVAPIKMFFFFPCLPSPPLRCLSVFSLISPLCLSLNFDIRSYPRMSVTNCSPTLWQCFCSPKPLYELPVFVSFFLFFPSRSGAPDVKPPRYGVYWFAFPSQPPDHNISLPLKSF